MNIQLNCGVEMPRVGLGTFKMGGKSPLGAAVRAAVAAGVCHIDTAAIYKVTTGVDEWTVSWGH
jgi:diketogulonate reductase-like aldo/keto reductase